MAGYVCMFCGKLIQRKVNHAKHLRSCNEARQQRQQQQQQQQRLPNHQPQQVTVDIVAEAVRLVLHQLVSNQVGAIQLQQAPERQRANRPSVTMFTASKGSTDRQTASTPLADQPSTSGLKRRHTNTPSSSGDKRRCFRCNACEIEFTSLVQLIAHQRTQAHMRKTSSPHLGDFVTSIKDSAFSNRIITLNINHVGKSSIDVRTFLVNNKFMILHLIQEQLNSMNPIKLNFELYANYLKRTEVVDTIELKSFAIKFRIVTLSTDLLEVFNSFSEELISKTDNFSARDSGWVLVSTSHLSINFNKYTPLKGNSYVPLPAEIRKKRAIVNPYNNDEACFLWAILAGMFPRHKNPQRISSYPHYSTVFNLQDISIPINFKDIPKFESQNNLSVNVYGLEYCPAKKRNVIVGPLHMTKNHHETRHYNLLFIEDENKKHYCLITNMSRLIRSQLTTHCTRTFLCDGCLLTFITEAKYITHITDGCNKVVTTLPSSRIIRNRLGNFVPENELQFTDYHTKMNIPFTIYADLESLVIPIATTQPNPNISYTQHTAIHKAYSFAYNIVCSFDKSLNKLVTYTGLDCCKVFIECLTQDCKRLYNNYLKVVVPMILLTPEQIAVYDSAITCHICEGIIGATDVKVRDHCHLTGAFVGAAHSNCNLNYKIPTFFPILFHNLSGYDSHLFIRELSLDQEPIEIIPQNMEKYISFSKTILVDSHPDVRNIDKHVFVKLRFLDSFKFMSSSLDKLSSNLSRGQLVNIKSYYPEAEKIALLCRKGIFPYSYITDFKTLSEPQLPTKDKFFNSLTDKHISDEDYEHAQNVWQTFNCRTLKEYAELYLITDVLLLSDTFEAFKSVCYSIYKLDPCHFYTAPALSWSAMLKHTGIKLQLLTDFEQHSFIRRGIRGGICNCSKRYAKANNKYMTTHDKDKPSSFLAYWDANNLYGFAMSQYLPCGGFSWLSNDEIEDFDVSTISTTSDVGYILEVDIDYPQSLHGKHNDLPFLAENTVPPNSKFNLPKLIADLNNKTKYIIHYRNLQQCLNHGLVLSKIHRVLKFTQSPFMKTYIDLNTKHRQLAKNTFEKDFFKLMNNSVYGKTMENIDKRVDIKLVTAWEDRHNHRGAGSLIARPNFKRSVIFEENLVGIHLNRLRVHYNKPTYIGFAVLELSKCLMYAFYYNCVKRQYGDRVTLCYMDTDSLILQIMTDDLFADMKLSYLQFFDTSNFPTDNPYDIPHQNKGIPGFFKDENGGRVMTEFVGLRSKMYAYIRDGDDSWNKRAKGVKRSVVENDIKGVDFVNCLFNSTLIYKKQNLFRSIKHTIVSISQNKLALSPHDDKRYIVEDKIHTLAWGSYKIPPDANDPNL